MKFSSIAPILAGLILASNARADDVQLSNPASAPAIAATASAFAGVHCVLRAESGQTQFKMGETIHLIASFTSDRPGFKINRLVQRNPSPSRLGDITITPADGVAAPLGELPKPNFFDFNGFIPEPVALGINPVKFPFVLNDWARFDKTGIYQVTLITARVFASKPNQKPSDLFFPTADLAQVVSQPLQIEITPADDAWANRQIEITRAYWKKTANLPSYSRTNLPQNDISFLGTRAAMTAIIEHLGQNTQPRWSSDDDAYAFRTGLIGFADRGWLIGEMKRFINQPNYAVTRGFFDLLSELQSLQNTPPRPPGADATPVKYDEGVGGKWISREPTPTQQLQLDGEGRRADARDAATARDWLQIAAASSKKTARARAMTLHTLLEIAWQTNLQKEPPIQAQLPRLIAQLAPIFDQLPPFPRADLLGNDWDNIKSPAFAPALQRLWKAPVKTDDYDAREVADLTLQRLYELDPKRNRALVVEQIKAAKPRVSIKALDILPDATLPALDDILAKHYLDTHGENIELAAQLLWRYASPAVLPRIKANYEQASDSNYTYSVPTLAYFVRVNPGYGVPKIAALLHRIGKAQYISLLSDVAALQPGSQLEPLAIAALNNMGEGAAIDAAHTLAIIGSPAAQTALMARLQNPAPVAYPKVRARIEPQLVRALADAQGWLCTPAQLRQIRALCQTDEGRRIADEFLRVRTDREPLVVDYSSGTDNYWSVDDYNGRGMETLRAKLAQFPRGTEFFWQMTGNRGPDADTDFATTQKWAAGRGLKIEPYAKISARRKALGLW